MLIASLFLVVTSVEPPSFLRDALVVEVSYTRKRRKSAANGIERKFSSCAAARRAGYTHMRRGQPGYSANLDRDGDGIACDKVK